MNKELVNSITKRVIIIAVILSVIMFIALDNPRSSILGLVFGCITSVLNLRLLNNSITRAVMMSPEDATSYTRRQYMIRYVIYFIVLLISAIADYLNLFTTVVGLLLIKLVVIVNYGIQEKNDLIDD